MGFLVTFAVLFVLMFGICVLAVAATPTSVAKNDAMLIAPALWCAGLAAVLTVLAAGVVHLFS